MNNRIMVPVKVLYVNRLLLEDYNYLYSRLITGTFVWNERDTAINRNLSMITTIFDNILRSVNLPTAPVLNNSNTNPSEIINTTPPPPPTPPTQQTHKQNT